MSLKLYQMKDLANLRLCYFLCLTMLGGFIFQVLHRVTSLKDSCEVEEIIFPITWFPFQTAHASSEVLLSVCTII